MNIGQLIAERGKPFYSFEFFPPKDPDQWPDFFKMAERLAPLEPLFTSVTYGAGGSSQDATLEIVSHLKKEFQFETMAHLDLRRRDAGLHYPISPAPARQRRG